MTAAEILRDLGHAVTEAAGSAEALDALAASDMDVLMVDVGLPGISGIELARIAKQRHPAIGIVFATGQEADVRLAGASVLAKPYDSRAIVGVLSKFV